MSEQLEMFALPMLIALYSPAAQSGKSSISAMLVEECDFVRVKFAQTIKDMTASFLQGLGFDQAKIVRMVDGDEKEQPVPGWPDFTPRHLQQTIGTDWGRGLIDQTIWVKMALQQIRRIRSSGRPVVVDDLRFANEFDAIKAEGGHCLRIVRKGMQAIPAAHPSEALLEARAFDFYLDNGGTLADLRCQLFAAIGR